MAFRFVHTGDLHLDSPFTGLTSKAPDSVLQTLRRATIAAWENVVGLALDERVDFLLVAGDAFENANRTLTGQLAFRDGLARLAAAGIASFTVTGNHDPLNGWEPTVSWPDLAHRFGGNEVTAQPVMRDGQEIARVYGISYARRDVSANLAGRFRRESDVPFAVGLLHANVGGLPGAANYAPCSIGDLRASGMDYWALGHIHRHHIVSERDPTAVYCGNPQGRDPGEADPRGCYLVSVDDAGRIRPEFRPTDAVRWQLIEVPIEPIATEEGLVDAVADAVDGARSAASRPIVARVTLVGRGPIHAALVRGDRLGAMRDEVLGAVQERLGLAEPFAWIESLRDATGPALDMDARREADDFVGDLLRRIQSVRAELTETAPDAPEQQGAPAAAEIGQALNTLFENPRAWRFLKDVRPEGPSLARLLAEAETLLLDRLGGEG